MYQLYKGDTPLATFVPKDASELPYSNGVSVKDKIDDIGFKKLSVMANSGVTVDYNNSIQIDKLVIVDMLITLAGSQGKSYRLAYDLPETVSPDNFQFWGIEVKAYPNFSTTPIGFRVYNAYQNGGIYSNIDISAGQYHVYGMYIAS